MAHDAPGPGGIERAQSLADACASAPVSNITGQTREQLTATPGNLPRHARQPRREHEGIDARSALGQSIHEVQHHTAVSFHRSADVRNQHDGPGGLPPLPSRKIAKVSAPHQVPSQERPEIDRTARGALPASGPPQTQSPGQGLQQLPRPFQLRIREIREVFRARHAVAAPRADRPRVGCVSSRPEILELDWQGHARCGPGDDAGPLAD